MQEVKLLDGTRIREFFTAREGGPSLREELKSRFDNAMQGYGDTIKEIRQVRIDRDEFCPCGSGRIFKRCCEGKVNAGPETVKVEATP